MTDAEYWESLTRPSALIHWTAFLDVNMLRDDEVEIVARYNIDDEAQLESLVEEWIRPQFLSYNEITRQSLRRILDHSDNWSTEEVSAVLENFGMPTGERFTDPQRFLTAMKRAARETDIPS